MWFCNLITLNESNDKLIRALILKCVDQRPGYLEDSIKNRLCSSSSITMNKATELATPSDFKF